MSAIGVRELKAQTSAILRRVSENGETIDITHHGRVVARLVPAHAPGVDVDQLAAELDELDRIAADISTAWPAGVSAEAAIRDVRREL